jgi:hypothetical protein
MVMASFLGNSREMLRECGESIQRHAGEQQARLLLWLDAQRTNRLNIHGTMTKAVALLSLLAISCAAARMPTDQAPAPASEPAASGASPLPVSASGEESDASADAGSSLRNRHGQLIPSSYSCVVSVLEYLATRHESSGAFDPKKTLDFDLGLFGSWVPDDGIEFSRDLPDSSIQKLSRAEVLAQLGHRKGMAFERLAHLGNAYSLPHPNQSGLSFTPSSGEAVNVHMGVAEYELTFNVHQGSCSLRAVHYLVREEE